MTLRQRLTLSHFRRAVHHHRMARPLGPIHRTAPPVIIIACLLWALLGVLWLPHLTAPAAAPEQRIVIAGALLRLGDYLCANNKGIDVIHRVADNSYTFRCRDGAQFVQLDVRLKEDAS